MILTMLPVACTREALRGRMTVSRRSVSVMPIEANTKVDIDIRFGGVKLDVVVRF